MAASIRASQKGLTIIDQERIKRGWNKDARAWIDAANISRSTLQRFWKEQPIRQENFLAICKAVGIDNWEEIVDYYPGSYSRTTTVQEVKDVDIIVHLLVQDLASEDISVRKKAADKLGQIGDEAVVPALIRAMEEDEDSDVRWRAIDALGQIRSDTAIPALIEVLSDEDPRVRHVAINALEQIGSDAAIPALLEILESEDSFVRSTAVAALVKIGSRNSVVINALVNLLQTEQDKQVLWQAARSLEEIDPGNVIVTDVLTELLATDQHSFQQVVQDLDWVRELFERSLQPTLASAQTWKALGSLQQQQGNYEAAMDSYDKALECNPNYSEAWYFRGNTLSQLSRYEEAIASYDNALMSFEEAFQFVESAVFTKTGKHLSNVQRLVLQGALQKQNYNQIAETYNYNESYIKEVGYTLWKLLSEVLGEAVNKSNSRTVLERKLLTDRDNLLNGLLPIHLFLEALYNRGNLLRKLGRTEKAITSYEYALVAAQKIGDRFGEANALNNLGNTYDSLGQYQQALEFYQQALAITEVLGDTGHREKVLSEITQIFIQIGEFERALATAQVIQDEQKRLKELTRVIEEVVSRVEGDRVREILASLRTDSDQRIRALVSRYLSTGTREALVVGINRYPLLGETLGSSAKHLETPARDAEAIAQLLEQYGNFRVTRLPARIIDGRIQIDPNKAVLLSDLEAAIAQLFVPDRGSSPETALLFFTGYGLKKSLGRFTEGFLATSDTNPNSSLYGVSLQWLKRLLQESSVQQRVIWLDCFHSSELFQLDDFSYELNPEQDFCFMATSREATYEETASDAHRTLTSALLQGLNPERRTDGLVGSVDLVDFVRQVLKDSPYLPVSSLLGRPITLTSRKTEGAKLQLTTTYDLSLSLSSENSF
jgi:HEAT repeat protein/DNA-binding Xre family transcriptional regulator